MNKIKWLRTVALAAAIGIAGVACGGGGGGGNPKALAKEQYELTQEAVKHKDNEKKLEEIRNKMKKSHEKVNNLSEADQKIFGEEISRLSSGK